MPTPWLIWTQQIRPDLDGCGRLLKFYYRRNQRADIYRQVKWLQTSSSLQIRTCPYSSQLLTLIALSYWNSMWCYLSNALVAKSYRIGRSWCQVSRWSTSWGYWPSARSNHWTADLCGKEPIKRCWRTVLRRSFHSTDMYVGRTHVCVTAMRIGCT